MTRLTTGSFCTWGLALAVTAILGTSTAGKAQNVCVGDCSGDEAVTVDEVVTCVNMALDLPDSGTCMECDGDSSGEVEITDIVEAVSDALTGCEVPQGTACTPYVPTECMELRPGMALDQPLNKCVVVKQGGATPYVYENVNIVQGGRLYFMEDPGKTIDFQVKSLLVEYGGILQAGSPDCAFGSAGGKLSIGIYGEDLSMQNTVMNPPKGIDCITGMGTDHACFPSSLHEPLPQTSRVDGTEGQGLAAGLGATPTATPHMRGTHYCTIANSDDPCASMTAPAERCAGYPTSSSTRCSDNFLLEPYGNLNFDPTPWGYKVLGVSYGGSLRLFGYKGSKSLQDPSFQDAADHCSVPTESGLNAAEVRAWAKLSGTSWVRLDAINSTRTQLTLDRLVKDWARGDQILVGTTDWYPTHSEVTTITDIDSVAGPDGMVTRLTVDKLQFDHSPSIFDTTKIAGATFTGPVNRTAADLRAVVGLLSRSIQIRSLGKAAQRMTTDAGFKPVKDCVYDGTSKGDPECYFGAHTMVRQGFREAQIQGVEFKQLGQGARIGHYPVHFHLAKSTKYTQNKAFVKDNSIWDSMTRFVVLHGTHNVTVARNVGYLSVGNGYYIEDGSEIENKLCHNLGVSARGALKEFYDAQKTNTQSPLARSIPPILDGSAPIPDAGTGAHRRLGADSYMPVMFWAMNAYNEFVGNAAVGVHGFGSCYWLLGSGVSGPSVTHFFAGLAKYNRVGAVQAPLLRFRGNSCGTATYALPSQTELLPAELGEATRTGYTALFNPYIFTETGGDKPAAATFQRPAVSGNFQPIVPDAGADTCAQTASLEGVFDHNVKACSTGIVDRFTTAFNWAQTNYGSIWFRPWYYLLLNGVVSDQLFGGVTFVTGGSWVQAPPAYLGLIKNNLFIGTSQQSNAFASRTGPVFRINSNADLTSYPPCAFPNGITCNLPVEGTGFWRGELQPKRLINIYDGPQFADGNLFMNIGSWECDPQPCQGHTTVEECGAPTLPCGIYSSTTQPYQSTGGNRRRMVVLDAAIGWKQPNSFYYPPAFAYRGSTFLKDVPTAIQDLNQCYSFGPPNYMTPTTRLGGCRHNVIDRTRPYIAGDMIKLNGAPAIFQENTTNPLAVSPVDFSTILNDLDGTLTGATGVVPGVSGAVPSSSVSRNHFFDAPAQSPECLSYGVQTSPFGFVTTVVAPLHDAPTTATYVEPWNYFNQDKQRIQASSAVVAIYRQWRLAEDAGTCEQVCNGSSYGCSRGTFMVGPDVGHAPYLTMTQPPTLPGQEGALYYIDTSTEAQQSLDCIKAKTVAMHRGPFAKNKSYVVYHLYARNDSKATYQFYVGDNPNLNALGGRFVRVTPHLTSSDTSNNLANFRSQVKEPCNPMTATSVDWCFGMKVSIQNGLLQVELDNTKIAKDFTIDDLKEYEKCMPRDVCYFDSGSKSCKPCLGDTSNPGCTRQGDIVAADITSMNTLDATGKAPLETICQDWSTWASAAKSATIGETSLTDCPSRGCLGFAFTMQDNFVGNKTYKDVGAAGARCFSQNDWLNKAKLEVRPNDPRCGTPRPAVAGDFCQDGGPTRTPTAMLTPTPTSMGGTPTRTPTGPSASTPTRTPTGMSPGTPTATPTGPRPTNTPTQNVPSPTPTRTPSVGQPTATPTLTPAMPTPTPTTGGGSGLSWMMSGMSSTSIRLPRGGMSYGPDQLILKDAQSRFCTGNLQPIIEVDFGNGSTAPIGFFGMGLTTSQVSIANIPGAPSAGARDVLVHTRGPGCQGGMQPTIIRMPGAVVYQ